MDHAENPPEDRWVQGLVLAGKDSATKRWLSVAVLAFTVFGVAAYMWFCWSPCGTTIKGRGYEGLLMDTRFTRPQNGPWHPSVEEIRELEKSLPEFVKSPVLLERLAQYRRTYTGVTRKVDNKRIIVAKFCAPSLLSRREWLNGICITGGGQENNWIVLYEPSSGSFTIPPYFEYVVTPQ